MTVQYWPRGGRAGEIAGDVERALAHGDLRPGDPLPPIRALARRLAVSPATVAAAYRELGRRGVVRSDGRRGTHVTGRPPVSTPAPVSPHPPSLSAATGPAADHDLSIGTPDPALLPDPAAALATAGTAVPRRYGRPAIDEELAAFAAGDLGADDIPIDALTVVNGALDGIERVLVATTRPGDAVAVEDPGYPPLLDLLAALGLRAAPVGIDDRGMTPDELDDALADGARALVLTTRAQNPTGAALDADRADELRQVQGRHPDVLVVEDDHAGPVAGVPARTVTGDLERWAVVRSVAKSLGPDFRLALLAGDPLTVARVEGRLRLGPGWVSGYLQRAAALLGRDPQVQDGLHRAARTYNERRAALRRALTDRGVVSEGRSGLNVWVPVTDEASTVGHLAAAGWTVAPGARFRVRTGPAVRITTAGLSVDDAPTVADAVAHAIEVTGARSTTRLG